MTIYRQDESEPITQGGIVADFKVQFMEYEEDKDDEHGEDDNESVTIKVKQINLKYAAILSQACDIEQSINNTDNDNNRLLNVLLLPMYILEEFKEGRHLEENFSMLQRPFNNKEIDKIKKNNSEIRYHFLDRSDEFIKHDTVIDFKHYYTIPKKIIISQYKEKYIATIGNLHRALLSQRFCFYLSRIAI